MENNTVRVSERNSIAICSIGADFTIAMEKLMHDIYDDLNEKGFKKILMEFKPENHITSGGIAILIGLLSESRKRNQDIGIIGLSEHFKKTFKMIGITHYTTIYDSLEEAIKKMSE